MTGSNHLVGRLAPITLVVGKGGVGKTTIAAALATRLASRGARTLVVTTDPAGTLLPALGLALDRTAAPRAVTDTLDAWAPDTTRVRDEFLERWRAPIRLILDRGTYLDDDDITALVDAALPGADEIFGLLALGDVAGRSGADAYARIVVDTAPTGHTLRLLNLPRSFSALVALLDAMQEKHRFMVRALTHRYRRDSADDLIAELRERVELLQRTLTDRSRAAAVIVTRVEPVVVAETERYLMALQLAAMPVAAIVVNAWRPEDGDQQREMTGLMAMAGNVGGRSPGPAIPVFTAPALPTAAATGEAPGIIATLLDSTTEVHDPSAGVPPAADDSVRAGTERARREVSRGDAIDLARLVSPLTIVGGKGGVGKTTVACALAIAAADAGQRTLLVSTDPAPSVGDALRLTIEDEEAFIDEVPGLVGRQMDATAAFGSFRGRYQERIDALFDGLTSRGIDIAHDRGIIRDLFALAPPGIDELYALTVLGDTLEEQRFDRIVIDPAPTGHLLRLLEMPALSIAWSRQLMRLMLKYRDVVGLGDEAAELLAFTRRTRALAERLGDPRSAGAILVGLDEPLVRGETARLATELERRGISVSAVVVNRASREAAPLPASGAAPQLVAPAWSPSPTGVAAIRAWSLAWSTLEP